ncbi:MAG: hypothetical protein LC790_21125, partial [Actinobacteria bacterium]|nr:hypothetical protein [Actinomycetota bacterium]
MRASRIRSCSATVALLAAWKACSPVAACPAPWHRRPDLVTQALVLLQRDGLVLVAAGSTRAWKITAAGRLMLAPRRGPARERPVIGG